MEDLPYRSKWFPFGPIFAFTLCLIVLLAQNYQAFMSDHIDWGSVLSAYLGILLFLVMWLGYKIFQENKSGSIKRMQI
ncbi:amino acid permease [Neobacillus niacini]|nr:amino acid permease [Neobacillus niacini]